MALDERATVAALDTARKVFRVHIESSQGRVIDMAGDSVLAVFETATGAVSARWLSRPNSGSSVPTCPKSAACAFASACIWAM
jgi:adenylate cyclase